MIFDFRGINGTQSKSFQTMFLDIEIIKHLPFLLVLIDFSLEMTLEPIESISENWMKIKKVSANYKRKIIHFEMPTFCNDFLL